MLFWMKLGIMIWTSRNQIKQRAIGLNAEKGCHLIPKTNPITYYKIGSYIKFSVKRPLMLLLSLELVTESVNQLWLWIVNLPKLWTNCYFPNFAISCVYSHLIYIFITMSTSPINTDHQSWLVKILTGFMSTYILASIRDPMA